METSATPPLRDLSAQEFIEILEGKKQGVKGYEQFYRNGGGYIVIEGVNVTEDLEIPTSFRSAELHIVIYGENQFGKFRIAGGTFLRDFWIAGGTFSGDFWIEDGTFSGDSGIEGGIFSGDFRISGGTFSRNFRIEDGTFSRDFRIYGGTFSNHFSILGGTFSSHFSISSGTFSDDFWILGGTFSRDFWIYGGTFSRDFWIAGGTFKRVIFNSTIKAILIKTLRVSMQPGALPLLQIRKINENDSIRTLLFSDVTLEEEGVIQVSGFQFNRVEFENVFNYGNITLTACHVVSTTVGDWTEAGDAKSELSIRNSDLGRTTLIGCDFSAAVFSLESSKITEVFVTGTQLPLNLSHESAEQQRIGYGQLKKVYENRGDITVANQYFARQMRAYYATIGWQEHFWEKINLWLNQVSTDHGTNWQRGLAAALGVAALFFGSYVLTLGILPNSLSQLVVVVFVLAAFLARMLLRQTLPWLNSTAIFSGYLFTLLWFAVVVLPSSARLFEVGSYFLEFLNPLHEPGFIAKELKNSYHARETTASRAIEGLSRIFIAYFIYQLIQAFRKHGRKGD